jgi:hypothetical protein
MEGKQQNGSISKTRRSQTGHKVCQLAEENGPKQEPHENEQSSRAKERQSLSVKQLAPKAAQAVEQSVQIVDGRQWVHHCGPQDRMTVDSALHEVELA